MPRAELSFILADLVRRNAITPEEAAATLARFDAGDLADIPLSGVPPAQEDNRWAVALAALLLLVGGHTRRPLTTAQRTRARAILRLNYEHNVAQLAAAVAGGREPVERWQVDMQDTITSYAHQMAVAGAGTLPRATVRNAVDTQLAGQWPYLAGFAVAIVVGKVAGSMMSEAAIASRSTLYGGPTGWGAYWRGAEPADELNQIVHYQPVDSPNTCSPCSEAGRNSPYAVGTNYPRPGEICRGGSRCKCTLSFEYNPAIYRQLTGR